MKPLRTLLVDLSYHMGGSKARALSVIQTMGPSRAALACLDQPFLIREAEAIGIEYHVVGKTKWDPRIPGRLIRLAHEGAFDVLDAQNMVSQVHAEIASKRAGDLTFVATLNSWMATELQGKARVTVYQLMERFIRHHAHGYIAVAAEIAAKLRASGVEPDMIHTVRNAIERPPFTEAQQQAWIKIHDIPASIKLVSVGRFVQAKGYCYLIDALAQLVDLEWTMFFVGDGELKEAIQQQASDAGLSKRVRFLGELPHHDAMGIASLADVYLMPSITEATPMALLEASSLARPIVASEVGGIPDLIIHETTGLLSAPGEVQPLADAIRRLIEDRPLAIALGQSAQRQVKQDFTLETQCHEIDAAYQAARAVQQGGPTE